MKISRELICVGILGTFSVLGVAGITVAESAPKTTDERVRALGAEVLAQAVGPNAHSIRDGSTLRATIPLEGGRLLTMLESATQQPDGQPDPVTVRKIELATVQDGAGDPATRTEQVTFTRIGDNWEIVERQSDASTTLAGGDSQDIAAIQSVLDHAEVAATTLGGRNEPIPPLYPLAQ